MESALFFRLVFKISRESPDTCDCVILQGQLQALSLRTEISFASCFGCVSQKAKISLRAQVTAKVAGLFCGT